jgi:hypothetical protein
MIKYDRKKHLEELHAERKAMTRKKVDEAIQKLIKVNKAINFNSVSLEAGLTKATLYNNVDIRERIETLRHQQAQVPTPAQVKIEMSENNKDAIIACLKRKIKKLEEDNKQLKEQVKINYGDIYKSI